MDTLNILDGKCCRACLQQQVGIREMFSFHLNVEFDGIENTLAEIYYQCTQLTDETSNTHWVCQQCFNKLSDFFHFRKMCIDSNKALQAANFNCVKTEQIDYEDSNPIESIQIVDRNFIAESTELNNSLENDKTDDESSTTMDDKVDDFEFTKNEVEDIIDSQNDNNELESSLEIPIQPEICPEGSIKNPVTKRQKLSSQSYYKCDKCSKKFLKKTRFEAHKRKHMGLKQWQCDQCEKGFDKSYSLKLHIASKHESMDINSEFICGIDDCGKKYIVKDSLRVHMLKAHIGGKPTLEKICEQCGKTFKNNAALVKHSYTHVEIKPFKCEICPRTFVSKYKLKEHTMRHQGVKNFECPTCGLRKTTGHELRVHMKFHNTDLSFPCELCPMIFTRPFNMKRHMRIVHCGVKKYRCTHCDQSFGKSETLKHHVMRHTGERPHACSICDKRFIQSIALKTHMKTHN